MSPISVCKMTGAQCRVEEAEKVRHRYAIGHPGCELVDLVYLGTRLSVQGSEGRLGETDVSMLASEAECGPRILVDVLVGLEECSLGNGRRVELVAKLEQGFEDLPNESSREVLDVAEVEVDFEDASGSVDLDGFSTVVGRIEVLAEVTTAARNRRRARRQSKEEGRGVGRVRESCVAVQ